MKKYLSLTLLLAVIFTAASFTAGCGKKIEPPKPTPTPTPTMIPHIQKIVYTYNGNLYWMNTDGTGKEEIFRDSNSKWFPSVSPDGWYVAYWAQSTQNNYNIWVGDFKARKAFQVTFDSETLDGDIQNFNISNAAAWNKESAMLVYSRYKDIWKMDREGFDQEALTDTHDAVSPALSKDGRLVFTRMENETTANIYSRSLEEKNEEKLTSVSGKKAVSPAFSPDGNKMVYVVLEKDTVNIFIKDFKAKTDKQLTYDGKSFAPSYSYDGKQIIFASNLVDKYQPEIWTMKEDGNDRRKITSEGGVNPAWLYRITAEFPPTPVPTPTLAPGQKAAPTVAVTPPAPGTAATAVPAAAKPTEAAIVPQKKDNKLIYELRINFDSGRARIKNDFYGELDRMAGEIKKFKKSPVTVEGHTDNVPIKTKEYRSNFELSLARAKAVKNYFVEKHGVEEKRIEAKGFGDSKPLVPNDTEEDKYKNRRSEIVIVIIPEEMPQPTATATATATVTPTPSPTPKLNFIQKILKPKDKAAGKGAKW